MYPLRPFHHEPRLAMSMFPFLAPAPDMFTFCAAHVWDPRSGELRPATMQAQIRTPPPPTFAALLCRPVCRVGHGHTGSARSPPRCPSTPSLWGPLLPGQPRDRWDFLVTLSSDASLCVHPCCSFGHLARLSAEEPRATSIAQAPPCLAWHSRRGWSRTHGAWELGRAPEGPVASPGLLAARGVFAFQAHFT